MTGPGFPRRGRGANPKGGRQAIIWPILPQTAVSGYAILFFQRSPHTLQGHKYNPVVISVILNNEL